jgi:hypothetical protein
MRHSARCGPLLKLTMMTVMSGVIATVRGVR